MTSQYTTFLTSMQNPLYTVNIASFSCWISKENVVYPHHHPVFVKEYWTWIWTWTWIQIELEIFLNFILDLVSGRDIFLKWHFYGVGHLGFDTYTGCGLYDGKVPLMHASTLLTSEVGSTHILFWDVPFLCPARILDAFQCFMWAGGLIFVVP